MTSCLVLRENRHFSLIPNNVLISNKSKYTFSFSSFIIMLIISLSYTAFVVLRGKGRKKELAERYSPAY